MAGFNLTRRLAAEGIGSCLLLAAVVGSGIMATRLAGGNEGLALLCNAVATGAALLALILTFGPISGAHLNPAVSIVAASQSELSWRDLPSYVAAQVLGALAGVALAHAMFGEPVVSWSHHAREGLPQFLSEGVATFGLISVIQGGSRGRPTMTAFAVAAYVVAAYWFTASTSFANPAVTIARATTDTFTGIRPANVPAFVAAQLIGSALASALFRWLLPTRGRSRHGRHRLGLEVEAEQLDGPRAGVVES